MMTVSELSKRGGLAPHVIRYYARIGLLEPARNPENGYKLFVASDVERLRFIRQAQNLGFTLEEISQFLAQSQDGRSPCAQVRHILQQRIEENRRKLSELLQLQQRMEQALVLWSEMPDQPSGHGRVCHLIETAADGTDA